MFARLRRTLVHVAAFACVASLTLLFAGSTASVPSATSVPSAASRDASPAPCEAPADPVSVPAWHAWDSDAAPNYYTVLGPARRTCDDPGRVRYGALDALGRATGAEACVTYDLMERGQARERVDTSQLFPSGWTENRIVTIPLPDGDAYRGYFWNRSHLLAKSLGGEEDLRNLICGTRMQNVGANNGQGGMAFCEDLARDWLGAHPDGWVSYIATPVYAADEPVARSVVVDLRSSDGSVDLCVEVYNAALGYTINYETGTFAPA